MKKLRLLVCIGAILAMLASCGKVQTPETTDETDTGAGTHDTTQLDNEVIEENKYCKIIRSDYLIYCDFYDSEGSVVKREGPMTKLPNVVLVDGNMLRLTMQSGTGLGTQYGYYYNYVDGTFSETFNSILDESEDKVAYIQENKVIVRNIFDKTEFYIEIDSFRNEFSQVAEPIVNAEFSDNGNSIKVTYISGNDYTEITEEFNLVTDTEDEYTIEEKSENYTVSRKLHGLDKYKVDIFDDEGTIIKSVSTRNEPNIVTVSYDGAKVIGVWSQAGTGISTRFAVFCNLSTGECTEEFTYYLDLYEDKIILGKIDGIVVRDIFSKETYCEEFNDFSSEIGAGLLDAVSAEFSDDGKSVTVTYRVSETETREKVYTVRD